VKLKFPSVCSISFHAALTSTPLTAGWFSTAVVPLPELENMPDGLATDSSAEVSIVSLLFLQLNKSRLTITKQDRILAVMVIVLILDSYWRLRFNYKETIC
jgi:hypothetical protein